MPLKRKLITIGDSRAVVLPADWLKYHEDKTGEKIEHILLEVDNIITLAVEQKDKREEAINAEL